MKNAPAPLLATILSCCLAASAVSPVLACSCAPPPPPLVAIVKADVVLTGRIDPGTFRHNSDAELRDQAITELARRIATAIVPEE